MAKAAKAKHKKRVWLYIEETGLTLFETGMGSDALPFLNVLAFVQDTEALSNPSKHAHWVKQTAGKKLNILLAHNQYQLLLSDVPDVAEDEINDAIELKAADLLSFDIDDAALDVIQLPQEAYRGRMRMAFIVAMQKSLLSGWLSELIQLGVKVDLIDVEVTQLRNLSLFHQNYNASGIFYLQNTGSRLVLNFNKEMVLSRAFDIGLSSLIAETTVQDGDLELTVTEDTQSEIQIESLVLEIRRSFDYYEAQLGLGNVAEIQFLCDEQHEPLATELAKRLGVRFTLMRPNDFMRISVQDETIDPLHYYGVTGSVYREALV